MAMPSISKVDDDEEVLWLFASGVSFGSCLTISSSVLSSRSPLKTGCRIIPLLVHSENLTSQISSGFIQWGVLPFNAIFSSKGFAFVSRLLNFLSSCFCSEEENPEPQFPIYVNFSSRYIPKIKDPNIEPPVLESVYPQMMVSSVFTLLILSQFSLL